MIELSLQLKGVEPLIKASASFKRRLPNTVSNAIRRPLRRVATRVKKDIRTKSGIGKTLWGRKGGTRALDRIVKILPAQIRNGGELYTGLRLRGLAKNIEDGTRIKPHLIKKAWGRVLVKHPGANVRAHYFATQAMKGVHNEIVAGVAADIEKLRAKVFNKEYDT